MPKKKYGKREESKTSRNKTSGKHKPLIENQDDYKRYKLIKLFREYAQEKDAHDLSLNKFLDYCKFRGVEFEEQELYSLMNVRTWQEFTSKMGMYNELDYRVRLRVLDAGVDYVREYAVLPDPDHWNRWAEDRDLPDEDWVEERFGSWDYFLDNVRKEIVKRYSYDVSKVERQIVKDYLTTGDLPDYKRLLRRYQKGDSFHPILVIGLYGSFDNLKKEIDSIVESVMRYEMAQFLDWTDKPFTPEEWNRYARVTEFVEYDRVKEYIERKVDVKDEPTAPVFLLDEFTPEITRTVKNRKRAKNRKPNTERWYDQDALVNMVKELAGELGKTPTLNEFLERYDISVMNIRKCTKNYQNLLINAGLLPNKIIGSDGELLFLGKEVVIRMGGCISSNQWEELRKKRWVLPSRETIFRRFGTWDRFWDAVAERFPEVADRIAKTNSKKGKKVYSRKELIDMGYEIYKKKGHVVHIGEWREIYKEESLPSDKTIVNKFGSFKAFWEEVAKEYPEVREKLDFTDMKYPYEKLIEIGYRVFKHFNRIPSYPEWIRAEKDMNLPSIVTLQNRFKGYYNFWYEVAKHYLEVEDYLATHKCGVWTREEILNAGVMASYFLGHLPSTKEWIMLKKEYPNDFGWLPSINTCRRKFISWKNFMKEVEKRIRGDKN
ncbi:hypothetical protein J7K41_02830 [Candidatus Micrarchaeota archaeon]|nr:hypothetical protein [Candidatus Micrarchaeota archaeon]